MGYARNVGRLGALAVALGVGYAVTDAPAFADGTDPSGPDDSSSASASPGRTGKAREASPGTVRSSTPQTSAAMPEASAPTADDGSDAVPTPRSAAATRVERVSPNRNSSPSDDAGLPAAQSDTAAESQNEAPQKVPAPAATASVSNESRSVTTPAPAAVQSGTAPAAATASMASVAAPAAVTVAPVHPAAAAVTPVSAVAQLVNTVLSPLLGNGTGGAPGQAPLLWTVLSWARRELDRAFPGSSPAAVTTTSLVQSPNLLVNPGAELSAPSLSGFSAVSMPGWTVTGTPTVIKYGTPRVIMPLGLAQPLPTLPSIWSFPSAKNGATDGGNQFFGGGNVADSTISQTVDLSAAGGTIDGGNVSYNLSGWLGGYSFDPSAATVKVTFLDANKTYLGTGQIGPVTAWDRLFAINLLERSTTGVLPTGTRYAQVDVIFDEQNPINYGFAADYNDAFADNIAFTIGADLPAPAAPQPIASAPPKLDHFFMVYMENKGYTNIVGSPNAPFLNSLINAYGFADDYYALTHGSLPNYYPIVGGDNFGITYNCASPCIDATTLLTTNIDNAGKTWKSYAQGLAPGGDPLVSTDGYSVDQTPFPAFTAIADDPAYAKVHIVPIEQMATDLQSAATTPNFVRFAADEDNNGEGPVDFPWGALKFVLNQFDPQHQYNVKALDAFLAETVPTILNSNAWKDPNAESVLVVTFDEDNNNTSLGFGNEGNHIVTVVIPNEAAIKAGWKGGAFTASNQYNHYSLLRTIEDSLDLPTLTANDQFAAPMNEFWNGNQNANSGSLVV